MITFYYENKPYQIENNETILECLLRHRVEYSHSCKSGICHSCIGKITKGDISPQWQKGLKDNLQAQGYFLPCIAKLNDDITFTTSNNNEIETIASIQELKYINHNVLKVKVTVKDVTNWMPGQYINLVNPFGDARSYSIANLPSEDNYIELHIKIINDGRMSNWLKNHAKIGSIVKLRGPSGDCYYYNPKKEKYPILLAATGTGLAPLIGIMKNAIQQNHQGEIIIIHGGCTEQDLYYDNQLDKLIKDNKNINYYSSILRNKDSKPIDKLFLQYSMRYKDAKVYICGSTQLTKKLKTTAFLAGVASNNIYCDDFAY